MLRFLPLALVAVLVPADAAAITSADITMQTLKITADQGFTLSSDNGSVTAQAGPDSFGSQDSHSSTISGTTSVDATNAVGTAHADSSLPAVQFGPGTTVTLAGRINASSSVDVSGKNASHSIGTSNPIFLFQAADASAENPIHVTFSMTIFGSIGGTTDPAGMYASEVKAQFGYFTGTPPFVPVDTFDLTLAGGVNHPLLILDPVTINGTATLKSSSDFFFEAFAQAQSTANDAVPEPLSVALFATGLAGVFTLRRRLLRSG